MHAIPYRRLALSLLLGIALAVHAAEPVSPPIYGMQMQEQWIRMPDGVRLAADVYFPEGAESDERFPALLEYLPYRKTESRARNWALYSYFVMRGYVVARVDIRGTGNSEGRLIPYEYSDIEQEDGEVVIDWLANQPWSNGNVGMFGVSWGGFNSIQMAVRNPPALKAIIAVDATEDLYQDDVHYMDGILHLDSWEMTQELDNARPGAPDYVLDDDNFRNRFDTEPWMLTYKKQQRDGPFWDRASARDKYDRIRIPSFHIGGWYDGYRDSLPRMLQSVEAPVKALIGPWSHAFPHDPYPKPGMEWRHEAVRWFDHWLKGKDTGIMDEPRFAVYVREWHPPGPYLEQVPGYWRWFDHWLKGKDTGILDEPRFAVYVREWHPPGPYLEEVPGYWRWEDGWPIERIEERRLYAQDNHTLSASPSADAVHQLRYHPTIGMEGGGPVQWWGDVAHDQRPTDAFSLVYDSASLASATEILGFPKALIKVSADAPRANWIVRLSDVAPDGTVTQVAGAAFNGTHRNSAREPEDLVPGEEFDLEIEMHFTSWVFPAGHHMRFAVNNAQWPMLWPTPYPMTTTLRLGGEDGAQILLPVVPPGKKDGPAFRSPAINPSLPGYETIDTGMPSGYGEVSSVERNPQTGEVTIRMNNTGGYKYPWGSELYRETIEHKTSDAQPAETSVKGTHRMEVILDQRRLLWEAELDFTSDLENFYYRYFRRVSENGQVVREKRWKETIPRDFQ